MLSFIVAGIVAVGTLGFAGLQFFAAGMSDVPRSQAGSSGAGGTLFVGLSIAAVIAASHWVRLPW